MFVVCVFVFQALALAGDKPQDPTCTPKPFSGHYASQDLSMFTYGNHGHSDSGAVGDYSFQGSSGKKWFCVENASGGYDVLNNRGRKVASLSTSIVGD